MPRPFATLGSLLLLLLLGVAACKDPSSVSSQVQPGKWLPYTEKATLAEQALLASLKVQRREAQTNSPTDTGETWFTSEVTWFNRYGQPTLSQERDLAGNIVKETRSDYRDSLLLRQAVTEGSGYSSAIHYVYSPQAHKVGELLFQRGDSVMRRTYTLDTLGNELEVALTRFRDGSKYQLFTERDPIGRPVKVREVQEGKTNWTETYALTDTLWRIQRTDAQGQRVSDYQMRFDARGSILRMVHLGPDGRIRLQVDYQNDAHGRPLKESYTAANGKPMQTVEYQYDAQGLRTERKLTTPQQPFALITRYTYFFGK